MSPLFAGCLALALVATFVAAFVLSARGKLLPPAPLFSRSCASACGLENLGGLMDEPLIDTKRGFAATTCSVLCGGHVVLIVQASSCPFCPEPLLVKVASAELARASVPSSAVCAAASREESEVFLSRSGWRGASFWLREPLLERLRLHRRGTLAGVLIVPPVGQRGAPRAWLFRGAGEGELRRSVGGVVSAFVARTRRGGHQSDARSGRGSAGRLPGSGEERR